ncbi:hypothetical protein BHM03_00030069 [Ensete ventricosum]|nr:hypothetical protein BHM03_00030069 [Ensete ventricosum]
MVVVEKGRETTIVVDVLGILEAGGVKDGHGVLFPSIHVVIITSVLAAAATAAVASSFSVGIYHLREEEGTDDDGRKRGGGGSKAFDAHYLKVNPAQT